MLNYKFFIKKIIKLIYFFFFRNCQYFFKKKLLFIHIPRSGGTNIKFQVEDKLLFNKIIYFNHQQNYNRLSKKFYRHKFCIFIRDPITWYLSYYNYKKTRNTQKNKKKYRLENQNFENFFEDIILQKHGDKGVQKWHQPHYENSLIDRLTKINNNQIGFYTKFILIYICKDYKELEQHIGDEFFCKKIFTKFGVENIYKQENFENSIDMINKKYKVNIDKKLKINQSKVDFSISDLTKDHIETIKNKDNIIYDLFY